MASKDFSESVCIDFQIEIPTPHDISANKPQGATVFVQGSNNRSEYKQMGEMSRNVLYFCLNIYNKQTDVQ